MTITSTLLMVTMLWSHPNPESNCQVAYQDATYGFHHAETAMEANNLEHLRQYAKRSKASIEKVFKSTEKCGCTDANNASLNALENLEKALDKDSFEAIRLFVSRAKKDTQEIFVALDVCSNTDPNIILKESQNELLAREKALLEQQKKLLEEQKKLEAQMKEQIAMQNELAEKKAAMFEAQKMIKKEAETTLDQLESLLIDFTGTMGCPKTTQLTEEPIGRTLSQLQDESLQATKIYYANKAREMANTLLNMLDECEWKQ
ncbi:MAG: hypothetical protein HKN48_06080 [Flavobacteriaceae bacterium]|nr:hypothetical protein [Flavobacteriaceae bacterium]